MWFVLTLAVKAAQTLVCFADNLIQVKTETSEAFMRIGAKGANCVLHISPWGITLALQVRNCIHQTAQVFSAVYTRLLGCVCVFLGLFVVVFWGGYNLGLPLFLFYPFLLLAHSPDVFFPNPPFSER